MTSPHYGTTWTETRPDQPGRWWINRGGQTDVIEARRIDGKMRVLIDHCWDDVANICALWAGPIPNPDEP